jgi:carotenoid cleavage dioxygenase-like enzyme
MTSKTMTAHPKFDPHTGEMLFYGAAAKGETTADIAIYSADRAGKITGERWILPPLATIVHDFAVTENWIIFPIQPTVSSLERLKRWEPIYDWEPEHGTYVGVMDRDLSSDRPVRWFRCEACFAFHVMNAFEDAAGKIHVDLSESKTQPFSFFHVNPAKTFKPQDALPFHTRWSLDPNGTTDSFVKTRLMDHIIEFPRIDERFGVRDYQHGFLLAFHPDHPFDPTPGAPGFNALVHWTNDDQEPKLWYAGDHRDLQEPQFVPRSADAPEGDGFLLAVRQCHDTLHSELLVLDTADITAGPIAIAKLPFRVRSAIHGCWVDSRS